jgi:hypothetical protein
MTRALPALLLAVFVLQAQAAEPAPAEFQWRATLDTAGQSGLLRVPLPADALARLQSRAASDIRVFDRDGQPVPFALTTPPLPDQLPRQSTAPLRALPLYGAPAGQPLPQGALQLRVDQQAQTVWVQMGGTAAPPAQAQPLPAALFDTRALKEPLGALVLQAKLPPNLPVRIAVSTSEDLASWTPVAVRGRIYRFEGEGAPANDRLELAEPLRLEQRYLRLDWSGQEGVAIESVTGMIARNRPEPVRPAAVLAAPQADGPAALEWDLPFATPITQLEIAATQANTLVPLRILGRNQVSEPWRYLGQAVVYRLGPPGQESTNPPAWLQRASVRWLRVEATHGARLQDVPLAVKALFDPVDVVFVAGANGPYQLAAGRSATPAAALPVGMLAAATPARIEDLPQAKLVDARAAPEPVRPAWARWLPRGVDTRTAALWLVLVFGVAVLGAVAWSLLRQVKSPSS